MGERWGSVQTSARQCWQVTAPLEDAERLPRTVGAPSFQIIHSPRRAWGHHAGEGTSLPPGHRFSSRGWELSSWHPEG